MDLIIQSDPRSSILSVIKVWYHNFEHLKSEKYDNKNHYFKLYTHSRKHLYLFA